MVCTFISLAAFNAKSISKQQDRACRSAQRLCAFLSGSSLIHNPSMSVCENEQYSGHKVDVRSTHVHKLELLCLQYVPSTTNTSLIVGVRVRPLLKSEQTKSNRKDIIRVIDGKVVVVLDPDESK
eukprot:scaffold12881_cov22-Tisochrysis_lutea.AAC.1